MPNQKNNKGKKSKRTNSSGDEQENGACAAATGGAAAAAAPRSERSSGKRGNGHRCSQVWWCCLPARGSSVLSVRLWHTCTATLQMFLCPTHLISACREHRAKLRLQFGAFSSLRGCRLNSGYISRSRLKALYEWSHFIDRLCGCEPASSLFWNVVKFGVCAISLQWFLKTTLVCFGSTILWEQRSNKLKCY